MTLKRVSILCLLWLISAWAALLNGQPFFMADTTAYVRGPDFAVVYLLGKKFATSWTQDHTLQTLNDSSRSEMARSPRPQSGEIGLNAPLENSVLAGRSIYYGTLLYVGHLTSHMWLVVLMQAAVFLYLTYTFAVKCLRLSIFTFSSVMTAVLVATPVSFFISFLMPDIFASLLALGVIIVGGYWNKLNFVDRITVSTIILFSALAHTTHLLLLIALGVLGAVVSIFRKPSSLRIRVLPKRGLVLVLLAVTALFGEQLFYSASRVLVGADPIRPPFLMARLIADGPGYQFLLKNCSTKSYAICNYVDRLPALSNDFLWSSDPQKGIFNVVDLQTRRSLSAEQIAFLFDVLRTDPVGVTRTVLRNFGSQLVAVGVTEFFLDPLKLQSYSKRLPASYFRGLLQSNIVPKTWLVPPLNLWYLSVYSLSLLMLTLIWIFWRSLHIADKFKFLDSNALYYTLTIAVMAPIFNAAICGVLSEPVWRYQARIAWLPVFMLAIFSAQWWQAFSKSGVSGKTAETLNKRVLT